jgi:hypothetical protein
MKAAVLVKSSAADTFQKCVEFAGFLISIIDAMRQERSQ